MDLLFKRYANPFFFLDSYISQLGKIVDFIMKKENEDKLWQMYVATLLVNDKSFEEFKQENMIQQNTFKEIKNTMASKEDIDATIEKSKEILSVFRPPKLRKEVNYGTRII